MTSRCLRIISCLLLRCVVGDVEQKKLDKEEVKRTLIRKVCIIHVLVYIYIWFVFVWSLTAVI
jgi:hypothetical protein